MYVACPVAFVPCAKQQNKYSAKQKNKLHCIKDLSVVVIVVVVFVVVVVIVVVVVVVVGVCLP